MQEQDEVVQADRESVSKIELFFDLVFVFTITQLTHLVEHAHGVGEILRCALVLALIWWMFAAFTWLTNDTGTRAYMKLVMIAGMGGFLVMAIALPKVFERDTLAFGLAYLFVTLLHLGTVAVLGGEGARRSIWHIGPYNLSAAALAVIAAFVPSQWKWLCFLAAVLTFVIATFLRRERGFSINARHMAERHGLVILIVLGESIISIGTGASEQGLDVRTLASSLLALALIATLWWSYFSGDSERAEEALDATPVEDRPRLALGFWYTHLAMLVGIVALAAGIKEAVGKGGAPVEMGGWLLAGGLALYLLGDLAFRVLLCIKSVAVRLVGAVLALSTGFLGPWLGSIIQLECLVVLTIVLLILETRVSPPDSC